MWFNPRPNVTLLCGRTQNQMLHSNVYRPMAKWYSLMWYPLYDLGSMIIVKLKSQITFLHRKNDFDDNHARYRLYLNVIESAT